MPSKGERIQAAKKLRKALQIALSAVELEPGDVAELGSAIFDPFDPSAKYKKGEICTYNGKSYICLKTVKRGTTPDQDSEHWSEFGTTETEPTDPGTEPEGPEEPTDDTYDPEKTYNKGDTVVYGGVTYVCQKNNVVGVTPGTNDKFWIAE